MLCSVVELTDIQGGRDHFIVKYIGLFIRKYCKEIQFVFVKIVKANRPNKELLSKTIFFFPLGN